MTLCGVQNCLWLKQIETCSSSSSSVDELDNYVPQPSSNKTCEILSGSWTVLGELICRPFSQCIKQFDLDCKTLVRASDGL